MGEIQLVYCEHCEFVYNRAFQPELIDYDSSYEETQGYSPTFTEFLNKMAANLVHQLDLKGKKILEIGCGKGQFLETMIQAGAGQAVGFDPVFVEGRLDPEIQDHIQIYKSFYSENNRGLVIDFVACRHTLEHIPQTLKFIQMVRSNLGEQKCPFFIEVPNLDAILQHQRFWDIYYEHCSYFNESSLQGLLERSGFLPAKLWTDYEDQYLLAIGNPMAPETSRGAEENQKAGSTTWEKIQIFTQKLQAQMESWQERLAEWEKQDKKIALWGTGSKAVSFLANLNYPTCIRQVVDINPHKRGKYMPKFAYSILVPDDLKKDPPDVVIVMNEIYLQEIKGMLQNIGIFPQVLALQ